MPLDHLSPNEPNPQMAELAERLAPAAAMITRGFWEAALRLPAPEDFDSPELGALWEAVTRARQAGSVAKFAVVRQLREMGWMETACFDALRGLDSAYLPLPEALQAVEFLLARRLRRQAATLCTETAAELATTADVQAVVVRHERAVADLARHHDAADAWVSVGEVKDKPVARVETGIEDLDRRTGGFPVGDVTIIAGRTGMGKTAKATGVMRSVAGRGLGAGCFSLEMERQQLVSRMACDEAWACDHVYGSGTDQRTDNPHYTEADRGMFASRDHEKRYLQARDALARLPIRLDDKKGRTLNQIVLGARRLKAAYSREGRDLKLLVIDHLGLVKPDGKGRESRHLDLSEISADLLALASDLQVAMVLLCQLNREVEKRPDKRPQLFDLRESGSLEEIAHQILLLYRPAYYDDRARDRGEKLDEDEARERRFKLEIHIAKNRGGQLGRVDAFCEVGANVIRDWNKGPMALGMQGGLGL